MTSSTVKSRVHDERPVRWARVNRMRRLAPPSDKISVGVQDSMILEHTVQQLRTIVLQMSTVHEFNADNKLAKQTVHDEERRRMFVEPKDYTEDFMRSIETPLELVYERVRFLKFHTYLMEIGVIRDEYACPFCFVPDTRSSAAVFARPQIAYMMHSQGRMLHIANMMYDMHDDDLRKAHGKFWRGGLTACPICKARLDWNP